DGDEFGDSQFHKPPTEASFDLRFEESIVAVFNQKSQIKNPFSFPRQRDDWVKTRSLERRIDACDHPYAARNADGKYDVEERHRHRHARRRRDEPGDAYGEEEAEDAAARRQKRRLDQKL